MKQSRITHDPNAPLVRAEKSDDGKRYFVGYAAVYNSRSRIIYEHGRIFYEVLIPGCFDRVLKDERLDVVLTINHQLIHNMARTISGTLSLESDERGLKFRALVPDTQDGNDTWEMISRGDYTDCSFSFAVDDSGEKWIREDKQLLHEVHDISMLEDIAICTLRGAYGATMVDTERALRAQIEFEEEDKASFYKLIKENKMLKDQVARLNESLNRK